jgi:hypothetical protein
VRFYGYVGQFFLTLSLRRQHIMVAETQGRAQLLTSWWSGSRERRLETERKRQRENEEVGLSQLALNLQ